MLDRLLLETEGGATPTAYSEDMSGDEEVKHSLEAMAACTKDDIVHWNWSIELVNSQVNKEKDRGCQSYSHLYI